MKKYEAKNLEEALKAAAQDKHVSVEELKYYVLEEKAGGLFGIGSKAIIEAYSVNDIQEFIESYLKQYFDNLGMGVELIAPNYAHSNVDLPSITAEMYSIFTRTGRIIIDVGGDDAGATALGRFSRRLAEKPYTMLYTINQYRSQSQTPEETVELLREIEMASRLKAHAIINNSHLMQFTTPETITDSFDYAEKISQITGLPIAATAAERSVAGKLADCGRAIWPVDVLVTKPWETDGRQGEC